MKLPSILILLVLFAGAAYAQPSVAVKLDEINYASCDDFSARVDHAGIEQRNQTGSKIYFIFYEGKKRANGYSAKDGKSNPALSGFQDFSDGIKKYLSFFKRESKNVIILNGGYRALHTVEIWIVPESAEPPKLTPTLDVKDIKFRKGKMRYYSSPCY
jgi:hypothetical protein